MKNYAGHRLSPWLGHLMISRQETARPLLTAGEVMQLPPSEELVLVSACHPIRAKKARYYEDGRFNARVLPPPSLALPSAGTSGGRPDRGADDWSDLPVPAPVDDAAGPTTSCCFEEVPIIAASAVSRHYLTTKRSRPKSSKPSTEFTFSEDEPDDDAIRAGTLRQRFGTVARQAALNPDDGISL